MIAAEVTTAAGKTAVGFPGVHGEHVRSQHDAYIAHDAPNRQGLDGMHARTHL